MSASQTNIEKQAKRHRGPLIGMAAVAVFALALYFGLLTYLSDQGGVPQGAEEQIDGRTGAVIEN